MSISIRTHCLITTALAASMQFTPIPSAMAQDYGVEHSSSNPLTITNPQGSTIEGALIGVLAGDGALTLNNAGTVRGAGNYDGFDHFPEGGVTFAGSPAQITNSGTISGAGHGISTAYFYNAQSQLLEGRAIDSSITNSGTILGETNDGIRLIGGGTIINSGLIKGTGSPNADGIAMFAYQPPEVTGASTVGQDLSGVTSIGTIDNLAGGTIQGDRFGIVNSNGGVISNAGTIHGTVGGVLVQSSVPGMVGTVSNASDGTISGSSGVTFGGTLAQATLTNSGMVTGSAAYGVLNNMDDAMRVENLATGQITGALGGILSESGALTVINAGTIRGNGTYDGLDAIPGGGIIIGQTGSSVHNNGIISGANVGITTISSYDAGLDTVVGKARNTLVENYGTITGDANDAIRLIGGGSVVNSGTILAASGATSDGISIYAFGDQDATGLSMIGSVVNSATGSISGTRFAVILSGGGAIENAGSMSGDQGGLLIQASNGETGKIATVTNSGLIEGAFGIGTAGSLEGAEINNAGSILGLSGAGLDLGTGTNIITNRAGGSIVSANGAALISTGRVVFTNAGVLAGSNGTAATLSAFDDHMTLKTGSSVTGMIDGGNGTDRLFLQGSLNSFTPTQVVGTVTGFETLGVDGGYWSNSGFVGSFDTVSIDDGAALRITDVGTPSGWTSSVLTTQVVNDGLLVFAFDHAEALDDADGLVISGRGGVRLEGTAIFTEVDGTKLTYTGPTEIANGGIVLTGSFAGDIVTSAAGLFQIGDGGTTGTLTGNLVNDGHFIFDRSDNYDFSGAFSGSGDFTKKGAGTLTFAGDYSYTGSTHVLGGTVKIAGALNPQTQVDLGEGIFDISGTPQTIAQLSGTGAGTVIIQNSVLTVNQTTASEYAGAIEGDGALVKTGDGRLNLTGVSTYTGPTTVQGGTLSVNGSIASIVTIDGGRLGGNGTVAGVIAAPNGILAPGNSIGNLHIIGDISFAAGSTYEVEVNAAGQADRIDATGTATISGGAVEVLAADGQYRGRTSYTILAAQGGVSGAFDTVASNLAFLTPSLVYSANTVTLELLRNNVAFADVANSPNQVSVANAVQALGVGNTLFEAVLPQDTAGAQAAYDALSGEIHASTASAIMNDSRLVRDAVLTGAVVPEHGLGIWGQAFGNWGKADPHNGVGQLFTENRGLISGIGFGANGFDVGLSGGVGNADYRASSRSSSADVDSNFVAGHAGYTTGPWAVRVGLAFAWHDIATSRSVVFPSFTGSPSANYDATTRQAFGEVSYGLEAGPFTLSPFGRLAHVRTRVDAFAEANGNGAALSAARTVRDVTLFAIGLRAGGTAELGSGARLLPNVSLAWQRASGDRAGDMHARFAGATSDFTVQGQLMPQNMVEIDSGIAVEFGNVRIGASYTGAIAKQWADHGAKAAISIRF